MTRNILVTGGAGFIGSHVVEAYLAAGDRVTVLDDLSTGRRAHVPAAAAFVEADIRSEQARRVVASGGFEVISHHAAQIDVRRSVADPVFDASVNLLGLLNILEGARAGGVRRVIFASSGGTVYGEAAVPPLHERLPKAPVSPYGTAKLAAEYYLAAFTRLHAREAVALRYSNVYGPRQDGLGEAGVVAIFARQVLEGKPLTVFGDGHQTRDMVFVKDVAAANINASACALPEPGDVDTCAFNIGTGVETSVNELATAIARAGGRTPELRYAPARPGELRRNALAVDKAAQVLRWRPLTTLGEGLRLTMRAMAEG